MANLDQIIASLLTKMFDDIINFKNRLTNILKSIHFFNNDNTISLSVLIDELNTYKLQVDDIKAKYSETLEYNPKTLHKFNSIKQEVQKCFDLYRKIVSSIKRKEHMDKVRVEQELFIKQYGNKLSKSVMDKNDNEKGIKNSIWSTSFIFENAKSLLNDLNEQKDKLLNTKGKMNLFGTLTGSIDRTLNDMTKTVKNDKVFSICILIVLVSIFIFMLYF